MSEQYHITVELSGESLRVAFDWALSQPEHEIPDLVGELYTYAAAILELPTEVIDNLFDEAR